LIQGLLVGSAAIGVPALLNHWIARRARRLPETSWGVSNSYLWRHGEIAYHQLGEGPPIVLLHSFGIGHSSQEWRQVADLLADHFEVFAPDLPGWGQSSRIGADARLALDGEHCLQLVRDFLIDVVDRRAVVVACGLSAAYAVQLAVDHPELVGSLGMVVPLGIEVHADEPDLNDAILNRVLRLPVLGTSALNLYTSRSGIANYLRREVYAAPALVDEALIDLHYLNSHRPGAQTALAAYVSGYLNFSVREVCQRLKIPVWLAWGRHAAQPPVEAADHWLKRIPDAELEIFERAGLLPHAETPGEFARKLQRFVLDARLDDFEPGRAG
jgi:pimeloyl-ACP methyl ester carboxylesterase